MTAPPATALPTHVADYTAIPLAMMIMKPMATDPLESDVSEVIAKVLSGQCAESIQGQRD